MNSTIEDEIMQAFAEVMAEENFTHLVKLNIQKSYDPYELDRWIKEHVVLGQYRTCTHTFGIMFKNADDAMLFKLTWGGVE